VLVVADGRFGTDCGSSLEGSRSPRKIDCFTLEDGTEYLSRNVYEHQHMLRNIIEEGRTQFTAVETRSFAKQRCFICRKTVNRNVIMLFFWFVVDKKELRKSVET